MANTPTESEPCFSRRDGFVRADFLQLTTGTVGYFLALGAILQALPRYVAGPLHGSPIMVGLVVGIFSISAALIRPLAGFLGDRLGHRALFIISAFIAGVSFASYGISASFPALLVLRVVSGAGEAGVFVASTTAAMVAAPPNRESAALSYVTAALYLGLAVGPLAASRLVPAGGYGAVWVFAGASAVIAGIVLLLPGTGLSQTLRAPPAAPLARRQRPRFVVRSALLPGVVLGLSMVGFAGYYAFVPLYGPTVGVQSTGTVFTVFALVILSTRLLAGRFLDVVGPRPASLASLAVMAAGLLILGWWRTVAGLYAGTATLAAGTAFEMPALLPLATRLVPSTQRGAAVATVTLFFDLAQGVGAPLLGTLVSAYGYSAAFYAGGACCAVGVGVLAGGTRLGRNYTEEQSQQSKELMARARGQRGHRADRPGGD